MDDRARAGLRGPLSVCGTDVTLFSRGCSGTQYTSAFDLKNLVIYCHMDTDRAARKVDLKKIDFDAIGPEPIH